MSMKVGEAPGRSLEADALDFLSPCGRGGDPLRSNGEVRGLPPELARGGNPLTLPAPRVPPERLSKGLSRKGRGKTAYPMLRRLHCGHSSGTLNGAGSAKRRSTFQLS